MQFRTIIAWSMATLATTSALPAEEIFNRSSSCLNGPKSAGDSCEAPNKGAHVCGPGQKGNILMCVENKNDDSFHWEVLTRCKVGTDDVDGGCEDCDCRAGLADPST